MHPAPQLDFIVGLGAAALQLLTVAFFGVFFLRKKIPDLGDVGSLLARWGLWIGFFLTFGATAMSLFYSEILGFAPCSWCWVMRIFMYSQVVLFALAIWKRDHNVADYAIALSIFGLLVGLYQHYLQMGGPALTPCPATLTQAADCATRFFFEFGYITFPLVGASLFAFLIVVMLFVRRSR